MALHKNVLLFLGLFVIQFGLGQNKAMAQSVVSGLVINQEDGRALEGAAVSSYVLKTGVLSDYRGRYTLKLAAEDTLIISFLGFKEQRIPVHGGWNTYYTINVSLDVLPVLLKNFVLIENKNFKDDSLKNRNEFQGIFNYKRPTLVSYNLPVINYDISNATYAYGYVGPEFSGGVGFSLNGFYSRFLNSNNDRYLHYRSILEKREKETYVKNYFNANSVHAITGLQGEELKFFLKNYEPKFKTLVGKSDYDIELIIKESFLKYKAQKQSSLTMPGKMMK